MKNTKQGLAAKLIRSFFWAVNRPTVPIAARRNFGTMKLAKDADPLPKNPFILVSNHSNFSDPWMVGHFSTTPVSIMMNEEGFKASAFTRWYLKNIGAFPKKKGLTDITAIKNSLRHLKRGYPLLVFPEGQTSWDGATQPIYPGIEKIAKKAKVALVLNRLHGNFLCDPWWGTEKRKGEIVIHRKVISAEQVQLMSNEELHNELLSYITHNDIKTYQDQKNLFHGEKLAEGLEQLLWVCPQCGSDHSLSFTPDAITCNSCSTTFSFYGNMTLTAPVNNCNDLYDWVHLQKTWVQTFLADTSAVALTEKEVQLVQVDYKGNQISLDTGSIEFNHSAFIFHGEDGVLTFELPHISAPIFQNKTILQFDSNGSTFQFNIQKKPLFKWLFLLRYSTGYAEVEERGFF